MTEIYPYSTGDLIETPNTYFYTAFGGQKFIDAWRHARAKVLAALPEPMEPPHAAEVDIQSRSAKHLLELALAGDVALREAFLVKFEITKRVHGGYDDKFRALDRKDCKDMSRYMRAADVFEAEYSVRQSLRYFNVLLKCLDTLCAHEKSLDGALPSRLAWHLIREENHFTKLSNLT
jgi:hypothetical protein